MAQVRTPRTSASWKERTGLSLPGTVSLVAVVSVLVLVSLPRLRGLARYENEADAQATIRLLAQELAVRESESDGHALPPTFFELVSSPEVERSLSDARFVQNGRLLLRHGYLFAVVRLPGAPPTDASAPRVVRAAGPPVAGAGAWGIRAWPWKHGHSGATALLATADGLTYRHANTPPVWNGPECEPEAPWSWSGWTQLR